MHAKGRMQEHEESMWRGVCNVGCMAVGAGKQASGGPLPPPAPAISHPHVSHPQTHSQAMCSSHHCCELKGQLNRLTINPNPKSTPTCADRHVQGLRAGHAASQCTACKTRKARDAAIRACGTCRHMHACKECMLPVWEHMKLVVCSNYKAHHHVSFWLKPQLSTDLCADHLSCPSSIQHLRVTA